MICVPGGVRDPQGRKLPTTRARERQSSSRLKSLVRCGLKSLFSALLILLETGPSSADKAEVVRGLSCGLIRCGPRQFAAIRPGRCSALGTGRRGPRISIRRPAKRVHHCRPNAGWVTRRVATGPTASAPAGARTKVGKTASALSFRAVPKWWAEDQIGWAASSAPIRQDLAHRV